MAQQQSGWTDLQMEAVLGYLLLAGVTLAAAVVSAGGAIYLVRHWSEAPNYLVFRSEPASLRRVGGIAQQVLTFRGRGIIQLGLLILIATPVIRVALSVAAFARQKDWTYVACTLIVLSLLLYGLTSGYL